ncbi:MAG: histidine ammonia-lyase [Planctomycetes bacterium]|nr:histidine ammonia-lyase [Planctomycetota bacterium]
MTPYSLILGERPLDLETLDACLGRRLRVTLAAEALQRVARGRRWVEEAARSGAAVYGINTGFGHLQNRRISDDQLEQLQENLLLSHAVAVGPPVPPDIVRWMLLFKTHMLLHGHSGARPETVRMLTAWLADDLLPVVPMRGSLGASGDLAPLAHLCLPLLGRGEMSVPRHATESGQDEREVHPAAEVLAAHGLQPLRLASKEGLALINGTQLMSAYLANVVVRAGRLADLADVIMCMSLEGLRGSIRPMDERLHELRPHPGAQTVAANIRRHMADSEILPSHANCERVQDPYSLRCAPQVHGAFREALWHASAVATREVNSVTDNPILFGSADDTDDQPVEAISGGNFHGAPLALVLDYLGIALTDLASISERRVYLLLAGHSGLPELLMQETGLNSGFMLPQYTAAALVNEAKVLATPASVDSIPTSLGQEDHVSMGATAALKCYEILDRAETVLAIELMCAAQAIDFRMPLKTGLGPRAAHEIVRRRITHAEADRLFGEDIAAALHLLRASAELRAVARC